MRLSLSKDIRRLDQAAVTEASLDTISLVRRSAMAVMRHLCDLPGNSRVVVLIGTGNNAADGLALACELLSKHRITVVSVLEGHRSEACAYFLQTYMDRGGAYCSLCDAEALIRSSDLIVDAIFGIGFHGELSQALRDLSALCASSQARRLAIDVPLGVHADTATVAEGALSVDITVALCSCKPAHVCYPARSFIGKLVTETLDLPAFLYDDYLSRAYRWVDQEEARRLLPPRRADGHKGSFGRALLIVGSAAFRGAAHLATEAALRGGVGYVTVASEASVTDSLLPVFPEALYDTLPKLQEACADTVDHVCTLSRASDITLIGCGLGNSSQLARLCLALLSDTGGPLVLDADALNALATLKNEGREALRQARRPLILTPHPTELARLLDLSTEHVQSRRLPIAMETANDLGCTVVLKGAATVTTDGTRVYINSTGTTALAKAGSGDVLAGCITALCAKSDPTEAAALGVYLHGRAGDLLSLRLTDLSVTPSDLPKAIGEAIHELLETK